MIIKRKTRIIFALMVMNVFLFQSCMTIMRGTSQKIPVTSNPSGAKIIVDGEEIGYAPLNLKLTRKTGHIIRIEKEGYNPFEIQVTRKTPLLPSVLSVWGNHFLGGVIGALLAKALLGKKATAGESEGMVIGVLLGWGGAIIVDYISGANYGLSPKQLIVKMLKKEEKSKSNIILIDAEHFQNIKWIRIKCDDSDGKDEIVNLD